MPITYSQQDTFNDLIETDTYILSLIGGTNDSIITINNTLSSFDSRITILENTPSVTQLWLLTDFSATLNSSVDNYIIYYDFSSDLFKLRVDQGGISDTPTSSFYVRSNGLWTILDDTPSIITINDSLNDIYSTINQIGLDIIDMHSEQLVQN